MRNFILLVSLLLLSTNAYAALEWQLDKPLELQQAPLASVSSSDGQRLYVLGAEGAIEVFTADGKRETVIELPFKAESLAISADGRRLFLREADKKELQVLKLQERYTIPQGNSPFMGPAEAAVSVVVFSDFQ